MAKIANFVLYFSSTDRTMKLFLLAFFCLKAFCIDIVFVCNKNYSHLLAACIESILTNKNANDEITIHVLHPDFSDKVIGMLEKIVKTRGKINFIKFDINKLAKFPGTFHIMGYAKALVPEYLPNLNKALYLDVDTMVLKSLNFLWNTDISNVYAAVVQNQFYEKSIENNNESKYNGKYSNVAKFFNSGVMLLNLEKIRADQIDKKFFYEMENEPHYYGDQPILNYVFKNKVKYLEPKWNAQSNLFLDKKFENGPLELDVNELREAIKDPCIVHFCSKAYKSKFHFFQGAFLYFMHKTPWHKQAVQIHEECESLTILHSIDSINLLEFFKIKAVIFWQLLTHIYETYL